LANVLQFFSEMLFQVKSSELMLNFPDLVRTEYRHLDIPVCRSGASPRLGKPTFPVITVFRDPYPSAPALFEFVTPDSLAIFDRLGLQGCNVSL
jgi:hypothetical protein